MNKIIKFLIDDEVEAIEGYNKAIAQIKDKTALEVLEFIKKQELEHIDLLTKLQKTIENLNIDLDKE